MTCREAVLLYEKQDTLTRTRRWRVALHILVCRGCRNYRRFTVLVRRQFGLSLDRLNEKLIESFTKKP